VTFVSDHQRIDERSLAMHRAIAEKLRRDPSLLAIARDNLARWDSAMPGASRYWKQWKELLDLPLDTLLERMVEPGEAMTAMRQSSPFAGILTPKERWAIYEAFAPGAYYSSGGRDCGR